MISYPCRFHRGKIMSDVQIAKPNRLKAFPFGEAALW